MPAPRQPAAAGKAPARAPAASSRSSDGVFPGQDGNNLVSLAPGLRKPPSKFGMMIRKLVRRVMLLTLVLGLGGGAIFLAIKFELWNKVFASKDTSKDVTTAPETRPTTKPEEPPPDPRAGINTGTGNEDPLAFVPPDAELIIGLDTALIQSDPLYKPYFDREMVNLGLVTTLAECKGLTGLDVKDLFNRTVVAFREAPAPGQPRPMTLIVQSTIAFDQKKMGKWAGKAPPSKFKDKYYYDKHGEFTTAKCVYMPSDRLLIMSESPAAQLEKLFTSDGLKPSYSADVGALIRAVDKNPVWAVMPFGGKTRDLVKSGQGPAQLFGLLMPANIMGTFNKVIPEARGMTFRANVEKDQLELGVGVGCHNDMFANELLRAVQNSWNQLKGDRLKKAQNAVIFEPERRQNIVKELGTNLQIVKQDLVVEASSKVGFPLVQPVLKEGPGGFEKQVFDVASMITSELGLKILPERALAILPEERAFLDLVNAYRKSKMVPELKPHPKLMEMARAHAAAMAKEGKLDDELNGKDTTIRVKDAGYKYKMGKLEFNMSVGPNLQPKAALDSWTKDVVKMEFLVGDFDETGVGVARAQDGMIFYYQVYAEPER